MYRGILASSAALIRACESLRTAPFLPAIGSAFTPYLPCSARRRSLKRRAVPSAAISDDMEATGIPDKGATLTIEEAYQEFIADLTARSLRHLGPRLASRPAIPTVFLPARHCRRALVRYFSRRPFQQYTKTRNGEVGPPVPDKSFAPQKRKQPPKQ
jgi:hypothetical protein